MVNEDLCWEEDVAELTLHRNSVLEDPLVDLDRADFLRELPITLLNVRDSLRQVLIRPHQVLLLFGQLFVMLTCLMGRLNFLFLNRIHKLSLHFLDCFLLKLLALEQLIPPLLFFLIACFPLLFSNDLLVLSLYL